MPSLTGYPPLDIVIGLGFVYLLFSVFCSAIQEAIAGVLKLRAKTLEEGLRSLLNGSTGSPAPATATTSGSAPATATATAPPTGAGAMTTTSSVPAQATTDMTQELLSHELIEPLSKGDRGPSYLSPRLFALALLDIAAPAGKADDPIAAVVSQIEAANLPTGLRKALLALAGGAATSRDDLRAEVEKWFNGTMERVSGWYTRKTRLWICVISAAATIGLNINTIGIAETLAKNDTVRAAVVAQAEKSEFGENGKLKEHVGLQEAADAVAKVGQLGVPLGWNKSASDPSQVSFASGGAALRTLGGWLLSILALSLGAPFWFELLGRLVNLRNSGPDPSPSSS